jgi:hypothetical protein
MCVSRMKLVGGGCQGPCRAGTRVPMLWPRHNLVFVTRVVSCHRPIELVVLGQPEARWRRRGAAACHDGGQGWRGVVEESRSSDSGGAVEEGEERGSSGAMQGCRVRVRSPGQLGE